MELDDLLKLIDHVSKSKLDDFCYETGEIKLRLKKNAAKEIVVQQKEVKTQRQNLPLFKIVRMFLTQIYQKRQMKHHLTNILILLCWYLLYGTGRRRSTVLYSVGDRVKKGQTLGIVEAMKLMHEITCEQNGIVKEICAQTVMLSSTVRSCLL